MSNSVRNCTADVNKGAVSGALLDGAPDRTMGAPVPSASPALRTIGWPIEPLYWAHSNHCTSHIRG